MLDMDEVTAALTSQDAVPATEGEAEYGKGMDSHSDMMCSLLMKMGGIDAKLDMLLAAEKEDEAEDAAEDATDGILSLPSSSQSDTYLPMDFMTMGG